MEATRAAHDDDRLATSVARVRRLAALEREPRVLPLPARDDARARLDVIAALTDLAPAVIREALGGRPRLRAFVLAGFRGVHHA